jgi:hypothetical protein
VRKALIAGVGIGLVVLLLATNPQRADYVGWLKEEAVQEESNGVVVKGAITLLGDWLIGSSTTSRDFGIFSVYKTKFDESTTITSLGIFNRFVILNHN